VPSDRASPTAGSPLLEVTGLKKHFPVRRGIIPRTRGYVYAVDDVSFVIGHGETLGLVGESGSGKTTLGKTVLRLVEPTAGTIRLAGDDITALPSSRMLPYRREMQIIFQDPYSSLNPRITVGTIVGEPLQVHGIARGKEKRERTAELLRRVGLRPEQMDNYANEFSGGQRQRIGIARALALNPKLIIADEPVSALDVSVQAQVVNLLMDLQEELGLSYLFIAHDLAVVAHISHRIAVMYLGKLVELADRRTLFANPLHPYTEGLLASVPVPDPHVRREARQLLPGDIPSPTDRPKGCHFHTRCPYVQNRCRTVEPKLREISPRHWAACHLR
jgi:oligopeptide/dipeptide ABC transporter ATP-binding protein